MSVVRILTFIRAPRHRVFDLARSIDLHLLSAATTQEKAIAGVTSGVVQLGDEVTWEARHLCIRQKLSVKITEFERPIYFRDTMTKGIFRTMSHDHYFIDQDDGTLMSDRFEFTMPFGMVGRIIDMLFLNRYLKRFLMRRTATIKVVAESDGYHTYVEGT